MVTREPAAATAVSLVDALDHLLNRGAVLFGETTLSLAGVDLVYVGLNLLVASVETLQPGASEPLLRGMRGPSADAPPRPADPPGGFRPPAGLARALPPAAAPLRMQQGGHAGTSVPPGAADSEPALERPEQGLARLVLTLVELLRQLLERQAVRRMEGAGLSDEQVERMGLALMDLERKMGEMREAFGLSEADLNLDLGPLGRLLDDRR